MHRNRVHVADQHELLGRLLFSKLAELWGQAAAQCDLFQLHPWLFSAIDPGINMIDGVVSGGGGKGLGGRGGGGGGGGGGR